MGWSKWNVRRASIISWLPILDRLKTRDRHVKWKVIQDRVYVLRDKGPKTRCLRQGIIYFFGCQFSSEVMNIIVQNFVTENLELAGRK